jgi:hypothetical protein
MKDCMGEGITSFLSCYWVYTTISKGVCMASKALSCLLDRSSAARATITIMTPMVLWIVSPTSRRSFPVVTRGLLPGGRLTA